MKLCKMDTKLQSTLLPIEHGIWRKKYFWTSEKNINGNANKQTNVKWDIKEKQLTGAKLSSTE